MSELTVTDLKPQGVQRNGFRGCETGIGTSSEQNLMEIGEEERRDDSDMQRLILIVLQMVVVRL